MLYWLFTEGRSAALLLFIPLSCLALLLPVVYAVVQGVGVRRADADTPEERGHRLRLLAHITLTGALMAVFVVLAGELAIQRGRGGQPSALLDVLVGAPSHIDRRRVLLFGLGMGGLLLVANLVLAGQFRPGSKLREWIDTLRTPHHKRGEAGSSHFCTPREFQRYRQPDPDGVTFFGAFWGDHGARLDGGQGQFCLSGEDAARGILAIGGPGSGKSQAVILPVIADRMQAGHSLIVADPQGELTQHIQRFAAATGHTIAIHDPTRSDTPRFNLADGIRTVSDARAVSEVLVPAAQGDNKFWSDSAAALLAACLLRFDTLGAVYTALADVNRLEQTLNQRHDDAHLLASGFTASLHSDGKVASNVIATLTTALTGWAAQTVRETTAGSDFDARLLVKRPAVIVLTCPGRMRAVYAPYLGAVLRRLMLDLDTLGEKHGGALPAPVAVVMDEFPALGRLDSLVADVNLVRKRRISVVIAAQTRGQFHLLYGQAGTEALFTGLATQIVFGGCDADTAAYYSKASGQSTETGQRKRADGTRDDYPRGRPLLTSDEVQSPPRGSCLIFARYADTDQAGQVVIAARLTRLYERLDWKQRLAGSRAEQPHLLQRRRSSPTGPIPIVKPPKAWRTKREQD
jgi:type IV secretory pathway TraG/TraD family ATPase VirD4